jgi:hypothetical protein
LKQSGKEVRGVERSNQIQERIRRGIELAGLGKEWGLGCEEEMSEMTKWMEVDFYDGNS